MATKNIPSTNVTFHIVDQSGEPELINLSIKHAPPGVRGDVTTMRELLLAELIADLERIGCRYAGISELAGVWGAVDEARAAYTR